MPLLARRTALLGLFLLVPGVAWAGQVKGHLAGAEKLLNPVWNEARSNPHRFTWREPSPTVRGDFRSLSGYAPKEVCIAALGAGVAPAPTAPMLVTVGGGRTTPVTLVVAPGTRLRFENHDTFPHKLYAVGQPGFAAAPIPMAGAREWTVPGPGTYELRDESTPSVRGWIVVDPRLAAVAYPNRDGAFTFAALAAGDYVVQAYFAGKPVGAPRPVSVGATGEQELKEPLVVAEAKDDKARDDKPKDDKSGGKR